MNLDVRRPWGIAIVRILLVLVMALMLAPSPRPASAALLSCRSDPVVLLSNGVLLDLSADIGTLLWNVKRVEYTLHVPPGVSAVAVIHTPAWLTTVETFNIYDDNPKGFYTSTTVVTTKGTGVSVTAHMLVGLATASKKGKDRQPLFLSLQGP